MGRAVPGGHPPGGHVIDGGIGAHAVGEFPAGGSDVARAGDRAQDELRVSVTPAGVVDEKLPRCRMGHSRNLVSGQAPGHGVCSAVRGRLSRLASRRITWVPPLQRFPRFRR